MTGILRFLFIVVLLSVLRYLFGIFFGQRRFPSGGRSPRSATGRPSGKMVKDPHCGTYVASELAIRGKQGGETYFFCSESCRDEFLRLSGARSAV